MTLEEQVSGGNGSKSLLPTNTRSAKVTMMHELWLDVRCRNHFSLSHSRNVKIEKAYKNQYLTDVTVFLTVHGSGRVKNTNKISRSELRI